MRVNIREVVEKSEIIRAFSHLYTDRSKVLLWQTSKSDKTKKTLFYCELISMDNKNIYLTPFNANIKNIIKKTISCNNKIFIRGSYNGVLFKSDDFQIKGKTIEVPLPTRILLSENRKSERYALDDSTYSYLKIENSALIGKHLRSSHKIYDFSENGISIHMTKKESHFYEINKEYPLRSINGLRIPRDYKAKLVYQKVHTYIKNSKTQVLFRAGFKFNKPLPKKIFNSLLDLYHKKRAA